MIICSWCGTNYLSFQSNCKNCGGPIQAPQEEKPSSAPTDRVKAPPLAPRPISNKYIWRLLSTDGWAIAVLVFGILGIVFSAVGTGLTLGIITAFVGIPFLIVGVVFLGFTIGGFSWRYRHAQKIVNVLRMGQAIRGQVLEVRENYSVRMNGRHPWMISYRFQVNGQEYGGAVKTWNPIGQEFQAGKAVWILYFEEDPKWNTVFPHP